MPNLRLPAPRPLVVVLLAASVLWSSRAQAEPDLSVASPLGHSITRGDLRFDAACSAVLSPCATLAAYAAPAGADFSAGVPPTATLLRAVNGATLADVVAPAGAGSVCFVATTVAGARAARCSAAFEPGSPRLVPVYSAPGAVVDADATRVLYSVPVSCPAGTCPEYHLRDSATASDTVLPLGGTFLKLTPLGAFGTAHEWRSGVAYAVPPGRAFATGGGVAAWLSPARFPPEDVLTVRDLLTGAETTRLVTESRAVSVPSNGDVWFLEWANTRSFSVQRLRAGVVTAMTTPTTYQSVVSDGVGAVITRLGGGAFPTTLLYVGPGPGLTTLASTSRGTGTPPQPTYALFAGAVAYTGFQSPMAGAPGISEVRHRDAAGAVTTIGPFAGGATTVEVLRSDRTIATNGSERYALSVGGAPERVSSSLGRAVVLAGEVHVVEGPRIFRLVAASEVPDGGVSDGGVSDGGVSDGGVSDGGVSDGGVSDGGVSDGGVSDGGVSDGGVSDGGVSGGGPAEGASDGGAGPGGGGEGGEGASVGGCTMHASGSGPVTALVVVAAVAGAVARRRRVR